MRSPEFDTPQERPQQAVEFENYLKQAIVKGAERARIFADIKDLIRKICIETAKRAGETEIMEKGGYMYFFRFYFNPPEDAEYVWRQMYDLHKELVAKDDGTGAEINLDNDLSYLLAPNRIGLTLNWRLVHAVIRGELEVCKGEFLGEEVFYMAHPDPTTRTKRFTSKARQNLSKKVQQDLKTQLQETGNEDNLLDKPIPGITTTGNSFSQEETRVLNKIYQYLQSDADMIYYCTKWRGGIDKFFDEDVKAILEEFIADLQQVAKTNPLVAEKYINYLKDVIDGYLEKLKQYCKDLSEHNQVNQLPADMLLEPLLIANGLLKDGIKTVPIGEVTKKWTTLWKEIHRLIQKQAEGTSYWIPALSQKAVTYEQYDGDNDAEAQAEVEPDESIQPDAFDEELVVVMPRHTHEVISPEMVAQAEAMGGEAQKLATLTADNVRRASAVAEDKPYKPIDINSTAAVTAIQEEELGRFSGSKPIENLNEPTPEKTINKNFDLRYKASQILDADTSLYDPEVVERMQQRIEKEIIPELDSHGLKKEFMIILLEKLDRCIETYPQVDFEYFQNMVRDMLNRFAIGEDTYQDAYIPGDTFMNDTRTEIPDLNEEGVADLEKQYTDLKKYLETKGDYQYFINVQRKVSQLIDDYILKLQIHRDFAKKVKVSTHPESAAKDYYKELKKTVLEIKKLKKRFRGFGALKSAWRRVSGKGKINQQAHIYLTQLDDAIDQLWEEGCIPTYTNFTKLYFGTQSE